MEGLLSGIKVLEVANWVAAPTAASLMADMGADVIKLEPPGGDPYRVVAGRAKEMQFPFEFSPNFQVGNRGKRSIAVDLRHPEARAVVLDVVADRDVFVCNLLPERREKFGLSEAELAACNPRLIDISLTGYGAVGPERNRPGFDFAAFWGRSGIMSTIGEPDAPPTSQRGGMGDHTTALNLLTALMACLRLRDATGKGQQAQVSLVSTGLWVLGGNVATALAGARQPPRHARAEPPDPLVNSYPTADGRWLMLGMVNSEGLWPACCQALAKPEWAADPRFATVEARRAHSAELAAALESVFLGRSLAEWTPVLDGAGLHWDPVAHSTEVIADPQATETGRFVVVNDPVHGRFTTLAAPFILSEGVPPPTRGAPQIGEHTDQVLEELGYDAERRARLRSEGVVGAAG